MRHWPFDPARWDESLAAVNYNARQAGRELLALADGDGVIERESVPRRASMTGHLSTLREVGLVERLRAGRLRLTMNASPIAIRMEAA